LQEEKTMAKPYQGIREKLPRALPRRRQITEYFNKAKQKEKPKFSEISVADDAPQQPYQAEPF